MATQKNKLFNFSHSVYNIDVNTASTLSKSNALNEIVERLFDKPAVLNTVKAFHDSPLETQRETLDRDPRGIISCFLEVTLKMEGNPDALIILLPYLDAFLFRSLTRQSKLRQVFQRVSHAGWRHSQVSEPHNSDQRSHVFQAESGRRGADFVRDFV